MTESIEFKKRRRLLGAIGLAGPALWLSGCGGDTAFATATSAFQPLDLSESQWREILTSEEFRVLRREGTEPAFSSPLDAEYGDGTYVCAGCNLALFSSEHKYDSGTGWPSFWKPIDPAHIGTKRDFKLIWPRTEYHCARCGGHQGHVFDDGPQPTGQRWCNNGVALRFIADGEAMPALRTGV
ncbi:MAG: peptide-methionine (R)-S-oxide reductase MsrB [Wenzhouxiangella sp.]|jgi:peptide-methionine (R)-S-oxide reductase|nr:peptide-methionine (R)-S-oxide reductase MsrB [Wenzhouxiangella sp.]